MIKNYHSSVISRLIFTLIFVVIVAGCDFSDTKLKVVNNSEQNVVVSVYSKWNDSNSDCVNCLVVDAGDTSNLAAMNTTWEHLINSRLDSLLVIRVLQEDTFKKYKWENKKPIFDEIKLSVAELDSLNWIINIPKQLTSKSHTYPITQ
ncbi:MAG: hypothetical protein ACK4NY_01210 [Spirosomataceae bacterium]